jgi:hypothetical protein
MGLSSEAMTQILHKSQRIPGGNCIPMMQIVVISYVDFSISTYISLN